MKYISICIIQLSALFILMQHAMVVCGQESDTLYRQKIIEYTTDSCFLPSSVVSVTMKKGIPSPLDYFGEMIGAPGVMHRTDEIYAYFKKLSEATPEMVMQIVGTSEEGRAINLVTISDEATIKNPDFYKDILSELADPRKTGDTKARQLIRDGKLVYYINGGIHPSEMGSPEMLMELAWRLVTDKSDETRQILKNCIVLINPVSEPDGRDKQVDWYYRYTKGRKDFDDGFKKNPPYWGKYAFHDNNRDGIQLSQELSKVLMRIYFEWHPYIMLDLHESIPLMYISTGTGPYNRNIDPITTGEWKTLADNEITSLTAQGLPGVFDWAFYDGWNPGYAIWVANNHNSVGRFYETFGNNSGDTYLRDISKANFAGDPVTTRQWYRPIPPAGKIYWSSRNNINYSEAGVLASLKFAAANRESFLDNFYRKGVNAINFSKNNKVKMFVIPENQRDPVMAAYLVNQLRKQGIEVYKVNNTENKYVVPLNQPYSRLAYDLLTKQHYPAGAKSDTYDAVAWTLGLMYGVEVQQADSTRYAANELTLLNKDISYSGKIEKTGTEYLIEYKAQYSIISGLYAAQKQFKNFSAYIMDSVTVAGADTLGKGTLLLKGLTEKQAKVWAEKYGIDMIATDRKWNNLRKISLPRLAMYHSWYDTSLEGWARFTLDQKKIPYITIDKDDLKEGKLRDKYDVIIVPQQYGDVSYFVNGIDKRYGPMPYTKTAEFKSHGTPDSTPDMTGGPGWNGLYNLRRFAEEGGTLIPLAFSTNILIKTGICPEVSCYSSGVYNPGSIVTVKARNTNSPILYGYPEIFHIFSGAGTVLETRLKDRGLMVLQYGTKPRKDELEYKGEIMGNVPDDLKAATLVKKDTSITNNAKVPEFVLSGIARNEDKIIGQGAILDVPLGKGRVVFFNFEPLHRYLNLYDSSLLWNTIINWDSL